MAWTPRDTDQLLINRDSIDYAAEVYQLRSDFGNSPRLPVPDAEAGYPWDDIPPCCGRYHIKNITNADDADEGGVRLSNHDSCEIRRLWKIKQGPDGISYHRIPLDKNKKYFLPLVEDSPDENPEYIYMTEMRYTFKDSSGNWDFGDLTDTSRLSNADYMFYNCDKFNSETVNKLDLSSCTSAHEMLVNCQEFDQDLSGMCVPNLGPDGGVHPKVYEEENWFQYTPMENKTEQHPVWGTCPSRNLDKPWDLIPEGHGRFHIKNIRDGDCYIGDVQKSQGNRLYVMRVYRMDGSQLTWDELEALDDDSGGKYWPAFEDGEYVIIARSRRLFSSSEGNWDFGELTDVSKIFDGTAMFKECDEFTGNGLEDWDVTSNRSFQQMFYGAVKLDVDLSGWCVDHIQHANNQITSHQNPATKGAFAGGCLLPPKKQPQWGTCPGGHS